MSVWPCCRWAPAAWLCPDPTSSGTAAHSIFGSRRRSPERNCSPSFRTFAPTCSRSINPDNHDFSVRNIDGTKAGSNLYDPSYATPYAIHVNLGVQRELAPGFVVSADVVWRQFVHTFINGIDYNRFNSADGPVIPACTPAQRSDVHAVCSNGNIYFDTTIGRARYKGLLVRVEKRFTRPGPVSRLLRAQQLRGQQRDRHRHE